MAKIKIDDPLFDRAKRAAQIAGRCSVFAKSDMIHAQQKGYRPPEVLKGLCDAVIRNFKLLSPSQVQDILNFLRSL